MSAERIEAIRSNLNLTGPERGHVGITHARYTIWTGSRVLDLPREIVDDETAKVEAVRRMVTDGITGELWARRDTNYEQKPCGRWTPVDV